MLKYDLPYIPYTKYIRDLKYKRYFAVAVLCTQTSYSVNEEFNNF